MPHALHVWTSADRAPSHVGAAARRVCDDALCAQAPRLRRLVHRLLGWRSRAEDLDDPVQDTLLAAIRHREGFRGDASLSTWLTRIAIRKAQDHVRRQERRRRLFGWLRHDPDDLPAGVEEPSASQEQLARTHQAMQRLAHQDREVLVLRYLEQRSPADIAQLLDCQRAAVDTRLTRARKRLRAELHREASQ